MTAQEPHTAEVSGPDGVSFTALEWNPGAADTLVFLLPGSQETAPWEAFAARFSGDFRVLLLSVPEHVRVDSLSTALQIAVDGILVAEGDAVGVACRVALSGQPPRLLALIEGCPPEDATPAVPTLLLRGRQSDSVPHAQAVAAFERLPQGRLFELENCADDPVREIPSQVETALRWLIAHPPGTLATSEDM